MDHTPLHETKTHGTAAFPYTVYRGMIPAYFHSFPLHWHDDFELIYCIRGRILVTVWGQPFTLSGGDMVVVLPRSLHSIDQWDNETGEYFNIMFHPTVFKGVQNDPCYDKYILPFLNGEKTLAPFHPADSPFNQTVTPCILSLLQHRRESYSTHELLVKSCLFLLLHHMAQYSTTADDNSLSQLSYGRLKNALYHIQHSYDQELSVKRVAEKCGFSESHFMKLFRELTGMSFNAYLVNYRLELAARQLSQTSLKVIDIAQNCGFHHQSYFTRIFRKKYGETPLAYRKTMLSGGKQHTKSSGVVSEPNPPISVPAKGMPESP